MRDQAAWLAALQGAASAGATAADWRVLFAPAASKREACAALDATAEFGAGGALRRAGLAAAVVCLTTAAKSCRALDDAQEVCEKAVGAKSVVGLNASAILRGKKLDFAPLLSSVQACSDPRLVASCVAQYVDWLPYGQESSYTYRVLLEMLNCIEGRRRSWRNVLWELIDAGDCRRAAELFLFNQRNEIDHEFTMLRLAKTDKNTFAKHVAPGCPAAELQSFVTSLVSPLGQKAVDALGATNSSKREHRPDDLVGRWTIGAQSHEFPFNEMIIRRQARAGSYDVEVRDAADDHLTFGGTLTAAPVVGMRAQSQAVLSALLSSNQVLQISSVKVRGQGWSAERWMELALTSAPSGAEVRVQARKDEIEAEPLETTLVKCWNDSLQTPATPSSVATWRSILKTHPWMCEHLSLYIAEEMEKGVEHWNPAALRPLFEVASSTPGSGSNTRKNVYEVISRAIVSKIPSSYNLVALAGCALLDGAPLDVAPDEMASCLKKTAALETSANKTNPLGVIAVINTLFEHSFDGSYAWYNSEASSVPIEDAFEVTGTHVHLNHASGVRKSSYSSHGDLVFTYHSKTSLHWVEVLVRRHVLEGKKGGKKSQQKRWHRGQYRVQDLSGYWEEWVACLFSAEQKQQAVHPDSGVLGIASMARGVLACGVEGWDGGAVDHCESAAEFVCSVVSRASAPEKEVEFMLELWAVACKQVMSGLAAVVDRSRVSTGRITTLAQWDQWVLGDVTSLQRLTEHRRRAAEILVAAYVQARQVRWNTVPVFFQPVKQLADANFPQAKALLSSITQGSATLAKNCASERVCGSVYRLLKPHADILQANGVTLPSFDFETPARQLESLRFVFNQLNTTWAASGLSVHSDSMAQVLLDIDEVDLSTQKETIHQSKTALGPIFSTPDIATSRVLRAYFLKATAHAPAGRGFVHHFNEACRAIRQVSLATTVREAMGSLVGEAGRLGDGERRKEKDLLLLVGCDPAVAEAMVDDCLPLCGAVHDLAVFREFALRGKPSLAFHDGFFTNSDRALLLRDSIDGERLSSVRALRVAIETLTEGCPHSVLELMRTLHRSPGLIDFVREHPGAQDSGLANVLCNARDMQHASFQTLLTCVPYLNPFVAASKKLALLRAGGAAGESERDIRDQLWPTLNNASGGGTGDLQGGFWRALKKAFADTTEAGVANVCRSVAKLSTKDAIAGLKTLIREQNGSTDRLVSLCGELVEESTLVIVSLPVSGELNLKCEVDGAAKVVNGSDYQALFFRAALQREVHPALSTFVEQGKDVLRAYSAAAALHGEGHLEFCSRELSFPHAEAGRVAGILRSLTGRWNTAPPKEPNALEKAGDTPSVLEEACGKIPELAYVAPSELIRLAELQRNSLPRSRIRTRSGGTCREKRAFLAYGGTVNLPSFETSPDGSTPPHFLARPTPITAAATTWKPKTQYQAKSPAPGVSIEGSGIVDGDYTEHLPTYRRGDGAVLAPVNGGWCIYSAANISSSLLLASAEPHADEYQPWELKDWYTTEGSTRKLSPAVSSIRVVPDLARSRPVAWSEDESQRLETLEISATAGCEAPQLQSVGSMLYVSGVPRLSCWESAGLVAGMRVVSVGGCRGSPKIMQQELLESIRRNKMMAMRVQSPWVWSNAPADVVVSPTGRVVTKVAGDEPSIVCSNGFGVWRIKLSGDVIGSRIGLCTNQLNFNSSQTDIGANAKEAYWYLRCGRLRHNSRDVAATSPWRAGDVVTVVHNRAAGTVSFCVNDELLPVKFTEVAGQTLHPCVLLARKTAAASVGAVCPAAGMRWDQKRSFAVTVSGSTVKLTDRNARLGVATAGPAMHGPGPHVFEVCVNNETNHASKESFYVGVAPPGVSTTTLFDTTVGFGMVVRGDGRVFGLGKSNGLYSGSAAKGEVWKSISFRFVVDLGKGTVDVYHGGGAVWNSARVVHSSTIPQPFPKATGPLVPYVALTDAGVSCTLVKVEPETLHYPCVTTAPPEVIVKDSTTRPQADRRTTEDTSAHERDDMQLEAPGDSKSESNNPMGRYVTWLPTYARADGMFRILYWENRWCVTDASDRLCFWSDEAPPSVPLGASPLRWSKMPGFEEVPACVRLSSPFAINGDGGLSDVVLQRQSFLIDGRVVYAQHGIQMSWRAEQKRWTVTTCPNQVPASAVYIYISVSSSSLPHHCYGWLVGDGGSWHHDPRITVAACSPTHPKSGDSVPVADTPPLSPIAGTGLQTAFVEAEPSHGAVVRRTGSEAWDLEEMTVDELAAWHLVQKATGARCKASELRVALHEATGGRSAKQWGIDLSVSWKTADEAVSAVRSRTLEQLQSIGKFITSFRGSIQYANQRSAVGFDKSATRFGRLQSRAVEGTSVVDTSRLPVADRKLFMLSLLPPEVRPYHVLDCTDDTQSHDVRAFLLLYRLTRKGRLVVFNLQLLPPELQNEVRVAAEHEFAEKELLVVISGGSGADETVNYVDRSCCDVRWRSWAADHVARLGKFESITYFAQGPGTGKSYTIEKQVKLGVWGVGAVPTRLDIQSMTTADQICSRLMSPLRAPTGLLVVHVSHDAPPPLVNNVLDGLIFLGKVQSRSGLAVTTPPKKGWHLVVEFEAPPDAEGEDRAKVNPPWKRADGSSDVTIIACKNVALHPVLIPFVVEEVPGAKEALVFLQAWLPSLPRDRTLLAHMLAGGIDLDDNANVRDTPESPQPATARRTTRALRFLAHQFAAFMPDAADASALSIAPQLAKLVACALVHEMAHFVAPAQPDHFHLIVERFRERGAMQLSGKTPGFLMDALVKYYKGNHTMLEMMSLNKSRTLHVEAYVSQLLNSLNGDAPVYKLTELLAADLGVKRKLVAPCLEDRSYILIPDFAEKLLQLKAHVAIGDPPILQGPSGTGKSYAVAMLSALLQLPSDCSAHSWRDLPDATYKFLVRLKHAFPGNSGDLVVRGKKVLFQGQAAKRSTAIMECLTELQQKGLSAALLSVASSANGVLGPLLAGGSHELLKREAAENRDFAGALRTLKAAAEAEKSGAGGPADGEVVGALRCVMDVVHTATSGMLTDVVVACLKQSLRSEAMRNHVGTAEFAAFEVTLTRNPKVDALRTWAEHALGAAADRSELVRSVQAFLLAELAATPLIQRPEDLVVRLTDSTLDPSPSEFAHIICSVAQLPRDPACATVLMRYDTTPESLYAELKPLFLRAEGAPTVRFTVLVDEMNATRILGLVKRIIVDRYWDLWEVDHPRAKGTIPQNLSFVGAVNPSKKDLALEGVDDGGAAAGVAAAEESLGFDVMPMPPSLAEYVVPWRQLTEGQRARFIDSLVASNKTLFSAKLSPSQTNLLASFLLRAHWLAQQMCRNKRSTVSQRDVHRTVQVFEFFYKRRVDFTSASPSASPPGQVCLWKLAVSSMLLGIAFSYYFRFPPEQRAEVSEDLTAHLRSRGLLGGDARFSTVVGAAVAHFTDPEHLTLPEAVHGHQGLLENLFVQMVCFDLRIAVILQGAPGTSKTLSNNIIRDNMTGSGLFWESLCSVTDVTRYQGSSQSTAGEIKKKCEEAYDKQVQNDASGSKNRRSLLFVDEAGLVQGKSRDKRWALKVLHYYLEGANLATVLMTNTTLDPAIGNRCIVVYMAKPMAEELAQMCAGILHKNGFNGLSDVARRIVPACCRAFHKLIPPAAGGDEGAQCERVDATARFRWWYGLRDLFHAMRYVRRHQPPAEGASPLVTMTPGLLTRALERNFNGLPDYFDRVLRVFGSLCGAVNTLYRYEALKAVLRPTLDVVVESLNDNNRATDSSTGKNLNDMWVRFKLIVDTTDDGSILQHMLNADLPQLSGVNVLSLSTLSSADSLNPLSVVSQVTAAMESGQTVWLTNTRAIDSCLFEVFNQNFVVASAVGLGNAAAAAPQADAGSGVVHFVPVAVGAALEYKRIDKGFQCVVHVSKREMSKMGQLLPSPFLNRLEKFALSVGDVLAYQKARLPRVQRGILTRARDQLEEFARVASVRDRCVFSDAEKETFDSLALRAIRGSELAPSIPTDPRVSADPILQHACPPFPAETLGKIPTDADPDATTVFSLSRSLALRVLQVARPEGMILAQSALSAVPVYLRAYFRNLSPWNLRGYLDQLSRSAAADPAARVRSVVYAPANIGFSACLDRIPGVTHVSVASFLHKERGREEFLERILEFSESSARLFVAVFSPSSIGEFEFEEVRLILESEQVSGAKAGAKAVVMVQCFEPRSVTDKTGCTPLFSSKWDAAYIDPAAEHLELDIMRYVDASIGTAAPQPPPQWKDIEPLLQQALNSVMQAQHEAALRWARVPQADKAAALYDLRTPFGEQLAVAKLLFASCPSVASTLIALHRATLPTPEELITMSTEVASREWASHSLAQQLVNEEREAPRALLAFALRFLLNDRTASALLSTDEGGGWADKIVALCLEIAVEHTSFDSLRHLRVSSLEPLYVGSTVPSLPGSSAMLDVLYVSAEATDSVAEAARLQQQHARGKVGALVAVVEEGRRVLHFFRDCVRARVRYSDPDCVAKVVEWVFALARGLHAKVFAGAAETVFSVRALCCVESAAIDDYIIAMAPLAAAGVLGVPNPATAAAADPGADWVAHELGPSLLIEAAPKMLVSKEGLVNLRTAISSLLHRVTDDSVSRSRFIPCLIVVAALLARTSDHVHKIRAFITSCQRIQAPALAIDLQSLQAVVAAAPSVAPKLTVELARLCRRFEKAPGHTALLLPSILEFASYAGVTRAMRARIFAYLLPDVYLSTGACSDGTVISGVAKVALARDTAPVPDRKGNLYTTYSYQPPTFRACAAPAALQNSLYTAIFDVCYDSFVGMDGRSLQVTSCVELAKRYLSASDEAPRPGGQAVEELLAASVWYRALEIALVHALALASARPKSESLARAWEPAFIKTAGDAECVRLAARKLMDSNDRLSTAPRESKSNVLLLLETLETGIGPHKGLGAGGMLDLLKDQVSGRNDGFLIRTCGGLLKQICDLARPFGSTCGDLPYLTNAEESTAVLHMNLERKFRQSDGKASAKENVNDIISTVREALRTTPVHRARLAFFYVAFKLFFGTQAVHPQAQSIANNDALVTMLSLGAKQKLVLWVALDFNKIDESVSAKLDVVGMLKEGFSNAWCEMICTALCVACAEPESWLGALFLNIDSQKGHFLPGDNTTSLLTETGCFKLDCVTQLDTSGKVALHGSLQPVLSTPSCYLLWGVMYGAFSIQLMLFPETFNMMWNYLTSPVLRRRDYDYQKGLTDYQHLVHRFTERSTAYFLHMGSNSGLSVDEAQRVYSYFIYFLFEAPASVKKRQRTSRDEALVAEREIEKFRVALFQSKRAKLAHPTPSVYEPLLRIWRENDRPSMLPRTSYIDAQLECLTPGEKPKLLSMAINEREKLSLLAPLLIDIHSFSAKTHAMLNNRLPLKHAVGGRMEMTPYRGVLQLFFEHTPTPVYTAAADQLLRIKSKWNEYMDTVGPIDYECEAGGINIYMDETPQTGAAGLPDTLDFWITYHNEVPDPDHRNLVKAALLSLIDKYNKCQAIVAQYTNSSIDDVELAMLNPSKPDLLLTEYKGLGEVCRSHVQSDQIDWADIEDELTFASGLILPRLLMPVLPEFRYVDPDARVTATDAEDEATAMLFLHPEKHCQPVSEEAAALINSSVGGLSEEQTTHLLISLAKAFKTRDSDAALVPELARCWDKKAPWLSSIRSWPPMKVGQLRGLLGLVLKRMEVADWLTRHLGVDFHADFPTELKREVDSRVAKTVGKAQAGKVVRAMEELLSATCELAVSHYEYLTDPAAPLVPLLAALVTADEDDTDALVFCYDGAQMKHVISLIRDLRSRLRSLRAASRTTAWEEPFSNLRERPFTVSRPTPTTDLRLQVDEQAVVTSVLPEGSASLAGVRAGMRITAVGMVRTRSRADVESALEGCGTVFEIAVATDAP
ncbi:hypothetical protein DIPPA_20689 [Diplonema papillatum]|nr:hypothetical protein DIPPA_20689 [Diplonema papillatum]